jgi:hypothetical protein
MPQLFANNAWSFLNGGINDTTTSIALSTGQGARFPSPTGGDYFLLTLIGLTDGNEATWEIVKVTTRTGDVLTVVRAQESTTAVSWLSGTRVELRMTAGQAALFDDKYSKSETDAAIAALVDSSPAALDTLNELAAALGDDANFSTTMTNALAGKAATSHNHDADYLGITAKAADADKLDGSDSTAFAKLASDAVFTADLQGKKLNETYVSVANGTSINCDNGNVFYAAPTAGKTYTFDNPPVSGTAYGFTLEMLPSGDNTYIWPTSVDWADGTAPDAPLGGERAVLTFFTRNGGTTWLGALIGKNFG